MKRLHLAKHDLAWLPPGYRKLRTAIIGGVWTVFGGGIAGLTIFSALHSAAAVLPKVVVAIGAGGYWIGDRISKHVIVSRLGKLASGDVDLGKLSNSEDGDLVHLRGTIRARETVPCTLGGTSGVYRRVRAAFGDVQAIEEVGVDFQLVDSEGNAIVIEVEHARWIVHDGKLKKTPRPDLAQFQELPEVQKMVQRRLRRSERVRATEDMLRAGDELEVVGYKSRTVDPTMADRMMREVPMRATLRGGKELPLLLSRVSKAS